MVSNSVFSAISTTLMKKPIVFCYPKSIKIKSALIRSLSPAKPKSVLTQCLVRNTNDSPSFAVETPPEFPSPPNREPDFVPEIPATPEIEPGSIPLEVPNDPPPNPTPDFPNPPLPSPPSPDIPKPPPRRTPVWEPPPPPDVVPPPSMPPEIRPPTGPFMV